MADSDIMVEFSHVFKQYRRQQRTDSLRDLLPHLTSSLWRRSAGERGNLFYAVNDVSFTVHRGEALGIIGHNGAGKSTILKLLAGVSAPSKGYKRVNGRFAALIELGAGFHPDLTGRENVYLNGAILGISRNDLTRKMESIVDFAGLSAFIDTPIKRYSSGMQARLGFAVAAHVDPEVLLIDEVLSVGDFAFQQKCMKKMEEFRNNGTAIVFVSHNLNAIAALCSSAILMKNGAVAHRGTPMEVIDAYSKVEYTVVSDDEASQITEMEHGRVSHHMQIVGADIRDQRGTPSRTFNSGEHATIVLHLRASRPIHEPIVGITLRNGAQVIAYETNTGFQKINLGSLTPSEEVIISFPLILNLCESTYSLTAGAAPSEGTVLLDWREGLLTFDIYSDQKGTGIADLRAEIVVERISAPHDALVFEQSVV